MKEVSLHLKNILNFVDVSGRIPMSIKEAEQLLKSRDYLKDYLKELEVVVVEEPLPPIPEEKKTRGRPKGSKNKAKWDMRNGD